MSGLEIFGVISAAATLIELAKKCSRRLKTIKNAHRDITALHERVEVLTEIVSHVSDVLRDIRRQHDGQAQITRAEVVIWGPMNAVLGLCHKTLTDLDNRIDHITSRGSRARFSAVPRDIARLTEDIKTYIQTLSMLEVLLQLIFQRQQIVAQRSIHRDIREIRATQENRMDEILRGIERINSQLLQQEGRQQSREEQEEHNRCDSVQRSDPLLGADDNIDSLSTHLNDIAIAATDMKDSLSNPQTYSIRSQAPWIGQANFPPSSNSPNAECPLGDPLPEITHIEPLQELAERFKQQAEYDLEHRHYEDAESHLLESIECFKELHDAHCVLFDSYNEMQMKLAKIYQKREKYDAAMQIIRLAATRPLAYDCELGRKKVPLDMSQDAIHRALVNHEMAELRLEQFLASRKSLPPTEDASAQDWLPLREAESNAKQAFRIRRDIYGKNDDYCKDSARLLVRIYTICRDKRMYAETYEDLYLLDSEHRNVLLTDPSESNTSSSRSLVPSDYSSLPDVVQNHDVPVEDVVAVMCGATLTELEQIQDGKSVMMMAMDCSQCDRCTKIVDKLLRLGADRDAAFTYAVRKQKIADCRFLLEHGANIDWLDPNRLTPLMHAIKEDDLDKVSFLLGQHADINVRGERGQTALHIATHRRSEKIFKTLLKTDGIDINARDDNGLTALHLCAKQDNLNFARRLHRAGANLEVKDKSDNERTPLWIATKEDKYKFAETLLKMGARVDLEALPQSKSRDMRNLLNSYQRQNPGSTSGT